MTMDNRRPGITTGQTATPRKILASLAGAQYLPGGKIIDGSKSRDWGQSASYRDVLRAGLLMGIDKGGKYIPSVLGITKNNESTTGSDVEVELTEDGMSYVIDELVGTGSDITIVGPPSAGGTVATESISVSAIDKTANSIDINISSDFAEGSLICFEDADGDICPPVTIFADEWGIKVTDENGSDIDVAMPHVLVAGMIDASQIIGYSDMDSAVQEWVKSKLRENAMGFVFDDDYLSK